MGHLKSRWFPARCIGIRQQDVYYWATLTEGKTFGVFSQLAWRLADPGAKYAFLRTGLGWDHTPAAMVQRDIELGDLAPPRIGNFQPQTLPIALLATYRTVQRLRSGLRCASSATHSLKMRTRVLSRLCG